ncbi:hypothetical protein llap_13214 [Limosa lapponica baueri]|uniref:Uncharacterized protein n=1 Tax=Limosa lapponica baueri TaxID=1758121 RepID=A0A2I0TRQ4_LIMLA|nr:hypothetical protein llap_13214 [Limosa lapponica baueri]
MGYSRCTLLVLLHATRAIYISSDLYFTYFHFYLLDEEPCPKCKDTFGPVLLRKCQPVREEPGTHKKQVKLEKCEPVVFEAWRVKCSSPVSTLVLLLNVGKKFNGRYNPEDTITMYKKMSPKGGVMPL